MKINKNEEKLKKVFEEQFSSSYKDKFVNLSIGDIEKWDSLGNFNFLLAIEKSFHIRFTNEEISELKSIKKILASLEKKNAK